MRVKGPNGLVYNLPQAVAESLVRDGSCEEVKAAPVAEKKSDAKPSVKK